MLTPAKEAWNSEPWPSITSQWSGSLAGASHSIAPEMKSATTASTEMPLPAMRMPLCPVARKSTFMPRARISFSMASEAYILPTEQSVPTVSRRLPGRFSPVPTWKPRVGWRTSNRCRPCCSATAARLGTSARRPCRPAARSRPMMSAFSRISIQSCEITPPRLATPTTSVRAPAATALVSVISVSPRSALQPFRRICPRHHSGRQWAMPWAVLAASWSGASPRNSRYGCSIAMTAEPPPVSRVCFPHVMRNPAGCHKPPHHAALCHKALCRSRLG